jgi:hypothetical protein
MTTRTIFPLLLAVAGLAPGCQDEPKSLPKSMPKLEAPAPKEVEPPALTAVAPAQPASIAEPVTAPQDPKQEPPVEISHAPEPTLSFDRPLDAKDVVLDRFVLAKDIAGREPVEESDHFTSDTDKIFAFVQLANTDAPYAFTVHFEPVDGPSSLYGVKLDVPTAARWRTWAWTKLVHEPGKYRAVLRTLEGEEIGAREFTVDAADQE